MSPVNNTQDPMHQIARNLELLLRLKVEELKKDRSQKEMIRSLFELGAESGEIASLLRVSNTTVNPELSKLRAAEKGTKPAASKARP